MLMFRPQPRSAPLRFPAVAAVLAALALGLLESTPAAGCEPRIVAAFDVGSGTTRMQVADIAQCREQAPKTLLRRELPLPFAADLAEQADDRFSTEMLERAGTALSELVAAARSAGAEDLFGVATAAFRGAANADAVLDDWRTRFNLHVDIIDQNEEGRLAFSMIEFGLDDPGALVVWDIGAGSQQLVWRNPEEGRFRHFNTTLAAVTFRNLSLEYLGRADGTSTPNPITPEEAQDLRGLVRVSLGDVPDDLLSLIRDGAKVVGVGGVHGASLIEQAGVQPGAVLTRSRLSEVLEQRVGLDDAAIGGDYADTQVTNLILVLALMDRFGIQAYRVTRADLTEALLIGALRQSGWRQAELAP